MVLSLKFLVLAVIFVITGGSVFLEWGRRRPVLAAMAAVIAIVGSTYLIRDIFNDLKSELADEILRNQVSEPTNSQNKTQIENRVNPTRQTVGKNCFQYEGNTYCD